MAGGDKTRAIMIGDSGVDVATAKAAGVPVIGGSFGYTETPVREFSPDGDAADSLRVVVISFVVALVAAGLFAAALKVSARNRAVANDNSSPDNRATDNTGATV